MTLSQFKTLVARFGPTVDDWPAAERESALDLLRTSAAAQDLFAAACLAADDGEDQDWPAAGHAPPAAFASH